MKRFAASILIGLGLMFGMVVGGASFAGAATTGATTAPLTFNSGAGTKPGHGSGLTHMKATKPATSSSGDPATSSASSTPASSTPAPAAASVATSPASSLAFTGADVTGTIIFGLVLVGAGLVLVRVTRRRQLLV